MSKRGLADRVKAKQVPRENKRQPEKGNKRKRERESQRQRDKVKTRRKGGKRRDKDNRKRLANGEQEKVREILCMSHMSVGNAKAWLKGHLPPQLPV